MSGQEIKKVSATARITTPNGIATDAVVTGGAIGGISGVLVKLFPNLPPELVTTIVSVVGVLARVLFQYFTNKLVVVGSQEKKVLDQQTMEVRSDDRKDY